MAAPRFVRVRRFGDGLSVAAAAAVVFLLCLLPSEAGAGGASSTVEFDVRPGGVVHSFSKNLGDYACTFTYAAQGGTNEQWQMSVELSEDNSQFFCSVWRPQGKSYLFFTQFRAEVKGAKIEHGTAYSTASVEGQNGIPLKEDEFHVTETAVSHREGRFRSELSMLQITAKTTHVEL